MTQDVNKDAFCKFDEEPVPAILADAKLGLSRVLRANGVAGDIVVDGPRIFQGNEMEDGVPTRGLRAIAEVGAPTPTASPLGKRPGETDEEYRARLQRVHEMTHEEKPVWSVWLTPDRTLTFRADNCYWAADGSLVLDNRNDTTGLTDVVAWFQKSAVLGFERLR